MYVVLLSHASHDLMLHVHCIYRDAGRTNKQTKRATKRAGGAWQGWRTKQGKKRKRANVKAGMPNTKVHKILPKEFLRAGRSNRHSEEANSNELAARGG